MVVCTVGDKEYPVALVQPYKPIAFRSRSRIDKELGLLRIRKEHLALIISVKSIIRGAVVVPASDEPLESDKFVWDPLDGDMFLRMKACFPGYTTSI